MAKTTTTNTRNLMLSDIHVLIPMLNKAEYNAKVALKQLNRAFRNHKSFELPETTPEQTRNYLYNNLIDLKEYLNQIDLGEKIEASKAEDKAY